MTRLQVLQGLEADTCLDMLQGVEVGCGFWNAGFQLISARETPRSTHRQLLSTDSQLTARSTRKLAAEKIARFLIQKHYWQNEHLKGLKQEA